MVIKKTYLKLQNLIARNQKHRIFMLHIKLLQKKFALRGKVGAHAPVRLGTLEDPIHHLPTVAADALRLLTQSLRKSKFK